jgi:hypothetical protein
VQKVLHGNWKTITFIAALRQNRVTAPFVLEGAMTGEIFRAYEPLAKLLVLSGLGGVAGPVYESSLLHFLA